MADTGNNSDLDTFRQLFGAFELYLPPETSSEDLEIPADIQDLLNLPFEDSISTEEQSESKSETENTITSSTVSNQQDVVAGDKEPDNDIKNLKPENATTSNRFKTLNDHDLDAIKQNKYAAKTQKNTKWGVNLFQEWCIERLGEKVALDSISKKELNAHLKKFYAEAAPKVTDTRKRKLEAEVSKEYHRNTLKNARAAINRYLRDNNLKIDIVRDPDFQEANDMLDAKIKTNLKNGLNLPVQHKAIIPPHHMSKIHKYLTTCNNPITLRYRIWYILSIQYVSRGLEFHPQLNTKSLNICTDANGVEFATLSHELQEKQNQSGVENTKRMYALGPDEQQNCPVQALKLYLSKCDPTAEKLFCQVNKLALENPDNTGMWYTTKPLGQRQFSSFMSDICRNAGLQERYTAHCLRATATQGLDDAGFELRHIMFMTGHRNEASVRSYNRSVKDQTKYKLSNTLTSITQGKSSGDQECNLQLLKPTPQAPVGVPSPLAPVAVPSPQAPVVSTQKASVAESPTQIFAPLSSTSTSVCTAGTMTMSMFNPSSCSFTNCTLNMSGGFKLD